MAAPSKGQDAYFQDKRGEINDLKNLLRDIHVERDPRKKREVVRKVIAFDTLGYDCSKLFSEMVIATSTNDIVVKKMAYQYLSHYARANEELATLCVNTMTKDCRDADPMVRGLAIRSLSSLRLKSTVEYLVPLLVAALDDSAGYVRRNGAVAVLKLFHLAPEMLIGEEVSIPFVSKLTQMMLSDRDPTVVSASIQTLDEIYREEGGLPCDTQLFRVLLSRVPEFNEWGLSTVLGVLGRYKPTDSQEMFDAMNVLDPCLRQTNSAVVLYAAKIFSKFAEDVPDIKTQVYLRMKEPLLTLMSSSTMEIKYTTLCHLELFIRESSIVFEDAFKSFFLKFDEPFQVKKIKLRILPLLANLDNYQEILMELTEYASDVNAHLSRHAIHAVARVALQTGSTGVDQVLFKLMEFLESLEDRVRGDVLDAFKDVLQEFPDRSGLVVPALPRVVLREIRGSAIWMLGEFGAQLDSSPYLLERLVERADEVESSVKCELLTALLKLFFKQRALEVRPALEKLMQKMLKDVSDVDAHDRAMFYYRLMRQDIFRAGEVVTNTYAQFKSQHARSLLAPVAGEETKPSEFFEELNSLAVVYGKHASQFVDEQHVFPERVQQSHSPAAPLANNNINAPQPSLGLGFTPPAAAVTGPDGSRPISYSDELYLGGTVAELSSMPPSASVKYRPDFELDQMQFQQVWITDAPDVKFAHHAAKPFAISGNDMEERLSQRNIKCMASGQVAPDAYKFYFYALPSNSQVPVLAEVSTDGNECEIQVKTTGSTQIAQQFALDIFEWA